MGLQQEYSEEFERLWNVYPKWPVGRSKKKPSYETFLKVKKALKFTAADIEHIAHDIESRVMSCATWQSEYRSPRDGRSVGPPMFSTYANQHLWNEPFERKGRPKPTSPAHVPFESTEQKEPPTEHERAAVRAILMKTGLLH